MNRLFEIIPGALAWLTIILVSIFSWLLPAYISIFIILFDIYWLFKTLYLSFHLRASFKEMAANLKIDWLEKLKKLSTLQVSSLNNTKKNKLLLQPSKHNWEDLYHLIILPVYKEGYEVIRECFLSLLKSNYPKDKIIIILTTEARAGEKSEETSQKIKREFSGQFFRFLATSHPFGVPNELPGKGSNIAFAGKKAKELTIDPLKIPYEKILVSVFDIDTQVPPDYFARLTYVFLTSPKPQRSSFQPIPLFNNNIYQAPALARVISFSATFWHMMQQSRPERLTTFSSHSMPFKALVEVGFWNTNIVSEDSRIFWQCYLHYNGDWRVEPLFYPVSMDANVAPTFSQTLVNIYKQQRRWGWGCENIPYLLYGFRKNPKIPLKKKWYWGFNVIEGFHSWATNALLIFALGWLPLMIGGGKFNSSLLSYNLPLVTRWIMTLSMVGIITSAILGIILLPPRPKWFKWQHNLLYLVQWLLMPFTLIVFGAFPGLEAQTRLMLGGKFRLGYWTTPKQR